MGFLTREQILTSDDRTYREVNCPEWGGEVRLQSLTAKELEEYQKSNRSQPDKQGNINIIWEGSAARLVVKCAVNDTGQRLFSDDDAPELGRKHAAPVSRLFKAACEMNGITEQEQEEILKNSEAIQESSSSSGSPNTSGE